MSDSHRRCSVCNRVSSKDIETNALETYKGNFVPDPINRLHFVCVDCKEVHEELMLDYAHKDGVWGWNGEVEHAVDDGVEYSSALARFTTTLDIEIVLEEKEDA